VGAVTIGQALHWMDHERLFRALPAVLRPGGGVAVVTNGIPVWLQDSDWSRALRGFLERWHGRPTTLTCGSADADQRRYRDTLTGAGFEVREARIEYADELDLEQLIGSVYSAVPVDRLPPPDRRPGFAEQLREALHPHVRYVEQVPVRLLFGRLG
jgi:SAM-dependent methyltransferase